MRAAVGRVVISMLDDTQRLLMMTLTDGGRRDVRRKKVLNIQPARQETKSEDLLDTTATGSTN